MKIRCLYDKLVDVKDLKKHAKNRNVHPESQIKRLAEILEYQGWRYPIKVSNRSGMITSGHGRLAAAQLKGWKQVPVNYQDYETEEMEYQDVIADNAIAEWADLDLSGINSDIGDLGPDFDIDMLGILDFKIDVNGDGDGDKDSVPEPPNKALTKLGDVYILGDHRLVCGDALKEESIQLLMEGETADMCFTDPPYGVNYEGGHFHSGDVKIKRKRENLEGDLDTEIYRHVVPVISKIVAGPCYTWFAGTKALQLFEAIEAIGEIHAMIIWHKVNATYAAMNSQYKQRHEPCLYWKPKGSNLRWCGPTNECTIWEIKRDSRNEFHPTQKPVDLAERAIKNHKVKSVLDLFGGSGSTLIACQTMETKCFMMEINPAYCDVIVSRWCNFTGTTSVFRNGEEIVWEI